MIPSPFQVPGLEALNALLPAFDFTTMLAANDYSAVFMARQRSLDRDVAVRLLSPEISGNPEFRQSFESTARTMARLKHPNLIGVFDSGFVDGMLYFIMEFVPGKSLEHSARGQQVEVTQTVRLIEAICDALAHAHAHAHAHGIYHGELDPGDILLNQKAEPKIGNFGFTHPLEDSNKASPFSAPELRAGSGADAKTDIYAVGALLYQLLTAHPHGSEAPPPSSLSSCGPYLDAIWKQATDPDPAKRFTDMAGFRKAVTGLGNTRPSGPARTPPISQQMAVAPRKTDSLRPAPAARTVVRKPKGTNWKLVLNVILNIILLGSLPFAWKHYKETRARKEKEFNEQIAREREQREPAERELGPPATTSGTPTKIPDQPRPAPKPAAPSETPSENLNRLRDALAAGQRDEMPLGSIRQGESDYLRIDDPMTWPEAVWFAEQHGAHLAIPSAGADLTWLFATVAEKRAIWLGAARGDRATWALADGERWTPKKEPAGPGNYLSLDRSGSLRAEPGNIKLPFVIQWHRDGKNPGSLSTLLESTRQSLGGANPTYPPGTIRSGNRHYLYLARPVEWREAADIAEKAGGHLAVTADPAEIPGISAMTDSISAPHGIWLGGFRKGDQWVWITGESWKSASWGSSRSNESEQSALVVFPMRGWDSRDRSDPASGFIIEWSNDRSSSPQSPATPSTSGPGPDTAGLTGKAKDLIAAANLKRAEQLAANAKKLAWDLDSHLRGLPKSEQVIWGSHIERLKATVANNRVPSSVPQSSGIKLNAKMAEIAQSCADKQARIDAEFLSEAGKIHSAYVSRLRESIANSRKTGQSAAVKSLEEVLSAADNLDEWVRALGVEPKPENPLPAAARGSKPADPGEKSGSNPPPKSLFE